MTTEANISTICKISAASKPALRKKIWAQWKSVVQTGNVITPSLVDLDDPRTGDIHLNNYIDDPSSLMKVNDIFIVNDEELITQSGYLFPIKTLKKALTESIDGEMHFEDEKYTFNAWFVKLESN